jgi:hypothetical protein
MNTVTKGYNRRMTDQGNPILNMFRKPPQLFFDKWAPLPTRRLGNAFPNSIEERRDLRFAEKAAAYRFAYTGMLLPDDWFTV